MEEEKIDLNKVRYLAFEGGGGKGLVYLGAIAALEHKINPEIPKAYAIIPDFREDIEVPMPDSWMTVTDRPLFDVGIHPDERPFAGVSGSSAGAITALFLGMGMSSSAIQNEINMIIPKALPLGNGTVDASLFELFFDDPNVHRNLVVDPLPSERSFNNNFVADGTLSDLVALISFKGVENELAENPSLLQLTLIRKLFLTAKAEDAEYANHTLYFQSLLTNRGLFTQRKVREYFRDVIKRRLFDRFPDWNTTFPDIPQDPGALTFRQFLNVTGVDLVVMGSNASQGSSLPFSAGATPDFPVAEALMLSMCIPILFKPLYIDTIVNANPKDLRVNDINAFYKGMWVDGGMLNNYPRHVFNYVKTVEGVEYGNDQKQIPVAMPWRLFDLRFVDLRPPDEQVLGFTLSNFEASEVDDPFAERDALISLKYSVGLLESMLKASTENQILGYEDEMMTIALDPEDISVVDFSGPELDKQRGFYELAEKKVRATREAFTRTFNRLQYLP